MNITDLGGHSGCKILLYEIDSKAEFVRKISSDITYNERLKLQAEKQKNFTSKNMKTPQVLRMGMTDEGLFYFDMEYIQGITLAEYMKTIEIGHIRNYVDLIIGSIVDLTDSTDIEENVFIDKIESLRNILMNKNNALINEALDILENHSWHNFTISNCHGDLTLENIIVKDNQLYVIDFLDSFYDSWILDMSTLMQDVQVMWSYRKEKNIDINVIIRLLVFRDILMDKMKNIVGGKYIEVYYALLLKLIRIYPYTKDNLTYEFLNKQTQTIISIIKEEELSK